MRAALSRGLPGYLGTVLAIACLIGQDSLYARPAVGLFLFAGAAFLLLGPLLGDLLGVALPTFGLASVRLRRIAAAVIAAPPLVLAAITLGPAPFATIPEVLPLALAVAVVTALAVDRLAPRLGAPDEPRFWLGAAVAGAELMVLFAYVFFAEDCLAEVRPGSERLHMLLFFGLWLVSIVLLIPWSGRVWGRVGAAAPSRWWWGWTALAALVGFGAFEVDRREMVGLYPAVHLWLELIGLLSLDAAIGRLVMTTRLGRRQVPARVTRALRRLGAVALAAIVAGAIGFAVVVRGGLASDRAFRAAVAETTIGPLLLGLARRPASDDRPIVVADHARYHDAPAPKNDWNIILISVDALRADALPAPESKDKRAAPRFAALAKTCVDLRRAYAPGSRTAIGMGSLMLGLYSAHIEWDLWIWKKGKLTDPRTATPEELRELGENIQYTTLPRIPAAGNLAQRLRAAGLRTLATPWDGFSEFFHVGNGFDVGFDDYADLAEYKWREPAAKEVFPRALEQIERAEGARFFQWIHLFDPHVSRGDRKAYAKLVKGMDAALGEFLDALTRKRLRKKTVIVVLADHGEALGDHRHKTHGTSLYEEQVRVPLLICIPGLKGRVFDRPVSTIDAAATMLALAGADLTGIDGVNLLPLIQDGRYPERRPVFTELHRYQSNRAERTADMQAVILDRWKLIRDNKTDTVKLFDLEADPKELRSVVGDEPAVADELEALLDGLNAARTPSP